MRPSVSFLRETITIIQQSTWSLSTQRDMLRYLHQQTDRLRSYYRTSSSESFLLLEKEKVALNAFQKDLERLLIHVEQELASDEPLPQLKDGKAREKF